jgi:hypothetical protein
MATGTGRTFVAFQICWKLWESGWNVRGEKRRPRILYPSDRNILIDDPKDKTFAPAMLGMNLAEILGRIILKSLLASRRAEVVRLAFILALELGRLLIDGHLAYRIYCHF